jgi:hypothetical protein
LCFLVSDFTIFISEALNVSSAARLKMAAIKIFSEFLDYEEQKMEELGEKSAMQTSKDKNEVKENAGLYLITLRTDFFPLSL